MKIPYPRNGYYYCLDVLIDTKGENRLEVSLAHKNDSYAYKQISILSDELLDELKKYNNVQFNWLDEKVIGIDKLPPNITKLEFYESYNFNQELNNLPINLKELTINLSNKYNYSFDYLPYGLEKLYLYLSINDNYDKPLNNLPPNLKTLHLALFVNDSFEISFPQYLEDFRVGEDIDLNTLPDTITKLKIYQCNKKTITKLPKNLKHIEISVENTQKKNIIDLVKKLEKSENRSITFTEFKIGDYYIPEKCYH